jgi:recombination endonuclease VII
VTEKAKEKARAKRLMDNYKLTVEKYDAILAYQNGVCYACQQPEPVKGRRLSVDHDHSTGLVRGLLCSRCNPIIGKLERAFLRYGLRKVVGLDVKTLATRIANYLWRPPAVKALGMEHFGYIGRIGTKAHRLRIRKEKKLMTPSKPPSRG